MPKEIVGFLQLLMVAGHETTTNLINNAILCLVENPQQRELLDHRPDLLGSAIEEVLRYRSPLRWMMRTPGVDIELHGKTTPAGKLVLPMIGSANRDPRQFTDAARFDVERQPNPHITFRHGMHFCLGAHLSRLEASIALPDIFERVQGFELTGDESWTPRKALHAMGPASLPIRFRPAAAKNSSGCRKVVRDTRRQLMAAFWRLRLRLWSQGSRINGRIRAVPQ